MPDFGRAVVASIDYKQHPAMSRLQLAMPIYLHVCHGLKTECVPCFFQSYNGNLVRNLEWGNLGKSKTKFMLNMKFCRLSRTMYIIYAFHCDGNQDRNYLSKATPRIMQHLYSWFPWSSLPRRNVKISRYNSCIIFKLSIYNFY